MVTCLHGTSYENYLSILKNGFSNDERKNWYCSEDLIYCYKKEHPENTEDDFLELAFQSAQITSALTNSKSDICIVIEFDVPEHALEPDRSCENMAELGAFEFCAEAHPPTILRVWKAPFHADLRYFYLTNLVNNDYLNLDLGTINFDILEKIAKLDAWEIYEDLLHEANNYSLYCEA